MSKKRSAFRLEEVKSTVPRRSLKRLSTLVKRICTSKGLLDASLADSQSQGHSVILRRNELATEATLM